MFTPKIGFGLITLATLLLSAVPAGAEGPNLGQPISQADLAPWDRSNSHFGWERGLSKGATD